MDLDHLADRGCRSAGQGNRADGDRHAEHEEVRLWTAHSDDRDFRNEKWTSQDLAMKPGSTQAAAEVAVPEKGFTAFMAELELTSPTGDAYKVSTQVQVTPDNVK